MVVKVHRHNRSPDFKLYPEHILFRGAKREIQLLRSNCLVTLCRRHTTIGIGRLGVQVLNHDCFARPILWALDSPHGFGISQIRRYLVQNVKPKAKGKEFLNSTYHFPLGLQKDWRAIRHADCNEYFGWKVNVGKM